MYFANLSNSFESFLVLLLSFSKRIFSFFLLRKTHVVFGPPSCFSLLAVYELINEIIRLMSELGADVYFSASFLNTVNNTNENLDKYSTGQTYVC